MTPPPDTPDLPQARRILAVGAHPDDVEFGCGGILIKEAAQGHVVTLLNLTRGEAATHGTPDERQREAEAAAARMGAALEFLDFEGDAHLEERPGNALKIALAIRRLRPDILLAPSPDGNQHPDHGKAGRMTRDAARLARYGGIRELETLPVHAVGALYFYDITGAAGVAGLAHLPKIVVDVSDVFGTWVEAMECHASQMQTRNYVELQVLRARALGATVGVAHAMAVWANDPIRLERLSEIAASGRRF